MTFWSALNLKDYVIVFLFFFVFGFWNVHKKYKANTNMYFYKQYFYVVDQ